MRSWLMDSQTVVPRRVSSVHSLWATAGPQLTPQNSSSHSLPQGQMQPLIRPSAVGELYCTVRTRYPTCSEKLSYLVGSPVVSKHSSPSSKAAPTPKAPHTMGKKDVSQARGAETSHRDTRIQSQPVDLWPNLALGKIIENLKQ